MYDERDRLIERIRKLLAVTENRGATENEAIAAALAAQKLMAEHDIEQWELSGESEEIESVTAYKRRNWQARLAVVVAENFRCKCYHQQSYEGDKRRRTSFVAFMGYRHDAEAAKIVYERLADVGNKLAREWTKEHVAELESLGYYDVKPKRVYNSYTASFVQGVRSVLEKQSQALMIVCPKNVQDAYDEQFQDKNVKTYSLSLETYRDDEASRSAGFTAGRDAVNSGRIGAAGAGYLITD